MDSQSFSKETIQVSIIARAILAIGVADRSSNMPVKLIWAWFECPCGIQFTRSQELSMPLRHAFERVVVAAVVDGVLQRWSWLWT